MLTKKMSTKELSGESLYDTFVIAIEYGLDKKSSPDNSSFPDQVLALPHAEQKRIYQLLYNVGHRINA